MNRHALSLFLLAPAVGLAAAALAPAPAKAQVEDRIMIVYGEDPCPASNGQAIVVCARKPETERYRIPKELRNEEASPTDVAWGSKLQDFEYVGKSGIQSCSASGDGGWSGCMKKILADARADQKAKTKQENDIP